MQLASKRNQWKTLSHPTRRSTSAKDKYPHIFIKPLFLSGHQLRETSAAAKIDLYPVTLRGSAPRNNEVQLRYGIETNEKRSHILPGEKPQTKFVILRNRPGENLIERETLSHLLKISFSFRDQLREIHLLLERICWGIICNRLKDRKSKEVQNHIKR